MAKREINIYWAYLRKLKSVEIFKAYVFTLI